MKILIVLLALATPAFADDGLYDRFCAPCHGSAGAGDGPAAPWLTPKPRDFTTGLYKYRTTPNGKPPTDEDLARTIRAGLPGTSMPAFDGIFSNAQLAGLVTTVKQFAPKRFASPATPITAAPAPTLDDARAAEGHTLFTKLGCATCHGPYDLTTTPLRRGQTPREIYLTLATGLAGTAMPAFAPSSPAEEAELWSLVAYVQSIRARERPGLPVLDRSMTAPAPGFTIAPQGTPPEALPPAAVSLSSEQCGRCHAKQLREWRGSIHAFAAGPGLAGQLASAKKPAADACLRCHAPLAEQLGDDPLRAEGVTCAACHVRGFTRHGPPRRADSALLPLPTYPMVVDAQYQRSDFCLPCHQLQAAVNGHPLLDTYREWLYGPYMKRGIQCQHCHMPDREHTWKGVHDPETVKQGLRVTAHATRAGAGLTVRVVAENIGAGHDLPTTTTPAAWIAVTLVDANQKAVGSEQRRRIGRDLRYQGGKWTEIEDTRIPPGASLDFPFAFPSIPSGATAARVVVTFSPDDYYEGFYTRLLTGTLSAQARADLEEARARAHRSTFVVSEQLLPL